MFLNILQNNFSQDKRNLEVRKLTYVNPLDIEDNEWNEDIKFQQRKTIFVCLIF